jgi:signal transduction histidine kinase
MDLRALRDHASAMLSAIAADLATSQSSHEQSEKSKGLAPTEESAPATAAEQHGAGRAISGFTLEQMIAEYRALRASVIRLWTMDKGEPPTEELEELTRFNEAIDQALAESMDRYNQELAQSKEMFLAILGHDLRLPLGAIYTSAAFMLESGELEEPHRALAGRIAHSASRTIEMVGDLLDFTRTRLGAGIPVVRADMSLEDVVRDVVAEISAAHPERPIHVDSNGASRGTWDRGRISQAIGNLIGNAVQHGSTGSTVTVKIRDGAELVAVAVHNHGASIPPEQLDGIFNPMKSRVAPRVPSERGPTGSLGLGLYIAERIASAHGGRIEVKSSPEDGTTFTMYLPRVEKPAER